MTTVAEFDWEAFARLHLDGQEEIVRAIDELKVALLTVETNDHRTARRLLREMVATLTEREFPTAVHRDWIRQAQQLVGPLDEPLPTAAEMRGIVSPEAPLPTIQRDED